MINIPATVQKPVLRCVTCGNLPETKFRQKITNKVVIRVSPDLRNEKRKTWKRIIKPSEIHKTNVRGKLVASKAILFSYFLVDCLERKHKIVKHIKPFKVKPDTAVIV